MKLERKQLKMDHRVTIFDTLQGEDGGWLLGWVDYFDIPLSAKSCLGRWKFGRIGWSVGQDVGTYQPNEQVTDHHPHHPTLNTKLYDSYAIPKRCHAIRLALNQEIEYC